MPFDGLVKTHTIDLNRCSIDALLAAHGIAAVPQEVLEQHKADQVNKHRASLFYRRPALHTLSTVVACLATLTSVAVFMFCNTTSPTAASITALAGVMISMMTVIELVLFARIKKPAAWRESSFSTEADKARESLPLPILDLVDRIDAGAHGVKFSVGTLYQEHVALDPYILAEKYDHDTATMTTACLGIWDGDQIIQIAQQS
jgi:hypothetical protein